MGIQTYHKFAQVAVRCVCVRASARRDSESRARFVSAKSRCSTAQNDPGQRCSRRAPHRGRHLRGGHRCSGRPRKRSARRLHAWKPRLRSSSFARPVTGVCKSCKSRRVRCCVGARQPSPPTPLTIRASPQLLHCPALLNTDPMRSVGMRRVRSEAGFQEEPAVGGEGSSAKSKLASGLLRRVVCPEEGQDGDEEHHSPRYDGCHERVRHRHRGAEPMQTN